MATFENRGNSQRATTYLPGLSCHQAPGMHKSGLSYYRQLWLLTCLLNNLSPRPIKPGSSLPHGQLPACLPTLLPTCERG